MRSSGFGVQSGPEIGDLEIYTGPHSIRYEVSTARGSGWVNAELETPNPEPRTPNSELGESPGMQ